MNGISAIAGGGGRLLPEPALSGRGRNLRNRDPADGYGETGDRYGQCRELGFSGGAVLRVAPGVAEAAELFDHMLLVTEFPAIAREIGSEARLHIRKHHALEPVARQVLGSSVRRCLIVVLIRLPLARRQRRCAASDQPTSTSRSRCATACGSAPTCFARPTTGRYPAILLRTPYGKGDAITPPISRS